MKQNDSLQRFLITLGLAFLMIFAFFLLRSNFEHSRAHSIDEVVYLRMAKQFYMDPSQYNTIPYGNELAASRRDLPEYFFQPLFKYPPLFVMLICGTFYLFGITFMSAYYVVLFCYVSIIPLTYKLARFQFNRLTSIMAVMFIFFDSITIMTSQKLWLDTPLSFFSLVSIYFFAKSLKSQKDVFFLYSGFFSGLAVLVKYSGIFPAMTFMVYAGLLNRKLFLNRNFWISYIIIFLMTLPWLLWNYNVYGYQFISTNFALHFSKVFQLEIIHKVTYISVIGVLIATAYQILRMKNPDFSISQEFSQLNVRRFKFLSAEILPILLFPYLLHAFSLTYLPKTSWGWGIFSNQPVYFYLGRLLEFSPLFLFAYGYFFLEYNKEANCSLRGFYKTTVAAILFIYMFWGNFQSRYIVVCIPLFLILASGFINALLSDAKYDKYFLGSKLIKISLISFIILFSLLKSSYINLNLSYGNNFCYF